MLSEAEKKVIRENERRKKNLFPDYNPLTGVGSLEERVALVLDSKHTIYLPKEMVDRYGIIKEVVGMGGLQKYVRGNKNIKEKEKWKKAFLLELHKARLRNDFEYWAIKKAWIKHKQTQRIVPFRLDVHQRYIVHELEKQRKARKPIRLIILKARQLGSSTISTLYMQWIATQLKENWSFAIAAHTQTASNTIKRIFELSMKMDGEFRLKNLGSPLVKQIEERGSVIRVGSAVKPDSLRGEDLQMIHYSEVGIWKRTRETDPDDLIASISGSVLPDADTCIIMESTAKSKGSFFYEQWDKAKNGESVFVPVFVAWWQVERYQIEMEDDKEKIEFYRGLDDYGRFLWKMGATLEGILWYKEKKKTLGGKTQKMKNEYPSTEEEAFTSVGERVFDIEYVENIKRNIREPKFIGEISGDGKKGRMALENIRFEENVENGGLRVWDMPDKEIRMTNRYIVSMDIGGRSEMADYSVIRVIDRYWRSEGGVDEFVATWRGHLDVDLAVWKAVQIAKAYNNALLVVERNTIDSQHQKTDGVHTFTVFNEIVPFYENIYADTDPQRVKEGLPPKYGFFTGSGSAKNSKQAIVDNLIGLMRESGFIEHDRQMIVECDQFVYKKDGGLGAEEGKNNHDDVIMASGIGLLVSNRIDMPKEITEENDFKVIKIGSRY
ncbi:MAG: hypothetical protein Q4Q06_04950 [Bacteroidota bacterium]|nr:hypothetical protein [Bacteroidota bacterium]